ncbi:MAG: S8 family serine peptidase [Clostridia bacterium]|nr:S8 family serine peptidase [Clostridia bacterium]
MYYIMKKTIIFIIIAAFFICSCLALAANEESGGDCGENKYDGYLVFLSDDIKTASLAELSSDGELTHVADNIYKTDDRELAELMLICGQAEHVEPDYYATLCDTDGGETVYYGWSYEAVEADYAEAFGLDGTGVRIAVIDSGLELNNPDLKNANICAGYDYINETTEMSDDVFHGTKVTQMICADKNDLGITGVARGVQIVPLRCFSKSKSPRVSDLVRIIDDAVNVYHCDVLNMSWTFDANTEALFQATKKAYDAGAVLVAAAGNVSSTAPQGRILYPAAYDHVISVSSVNKNLSYVYSSQHNSHVTVCGPGEGVTFIMADGTSLISSGTSFAAPCVSGEAAILLQLAPDMDNATVMKLFKERAVDLGAKDYDIYYGYGFANIRALLDSSWVDLKPADEGYIASAWILNEDGGYITSASYDDAGRLTGTSLYKTYNPREYVKFTIVPKSGDARETFFFFDRDMHPLAEKCDFFFDAES